MANASHDWHYIDSVAVVLYLKVVSNETVIFKSDCQHAFIRRNIEAQWLAVVVLCFEGDWHLDWKEVEEPDVVVIASCDQEENFLILSSSADRLFVSRCLELTHISHSLIDSSGRLVSDCSRISHCLPRGIDLRYLLSFTFLFRGIFQREPQHLNIVDLTTVKSKNQLWIYNFFTFAKVGHAEIILFVFNIINFTRIGNHPVELVIALVQALLLPGFARLLGIINALSIRILLILVLFLLLVCFAVRVLIVHLLKVKILNNLLHLLNYIRLANEVLSIFLSRVPLVSTNLHHTLRIVFIGVQWYIFLININASILKNDGELFARGLLGYSLRLSILLNNLCNRSGQRRWFDPSNDFRSFTLVKRHLRIRIEALDVAFLD